MRNIAKLNRDFLLIAFVAFAADQITKYLVFMYEGTELVNLFNGFFIIEHAMNTGAVFGMGQNMNLWFAVLSASFLVLMVPFFTIHFLPHKGTALTAVASGLAYGGVAGNYFDRIVFGAVRDFITVGPWPTFNVADACICSGVLYFAWRIAFDKPEENALNETT